MLVTSTTIMGISREELFNSLLKELKKWENPMYTYETSNLSVIFVERWFLRAHGNLMVGILIKETGDNLSITIIAGGGTGEFGSAESKAIKYVIKIFQDLSKSKRFSFKVGKEERIYEETI